MFASWYRWIVNPVCSLMPLDLKLWLPVDTVGLKFGLPLNVFRAFNYIGPLICVLFLWHQTCQASDVSFCLIFRPRRHRIRFVEAPEASTISRVALGKYRALWGPIWNYIQGLCSYFFVFSWNPGPWRSHHPPRIEAHLCPQHLSSSNNLHLCVYAYVCGSDKGVRACQGSGFH